MSGRSFNFTKIQSLSSYTPYCTCVWVRVYSTVYICNVTCESGIGIFISIVITKCNICVGEGKKVYEYINIFVYKYSINNRIIIVQQ